MRTLVAEKESEKGGKGKKKNYTFSAEGSFSPGHGKILIGKKKKISWGTKGGKKKAYFR